MMPAAIVPSTSSSVDVAEAASTAAAPTDAGSGGFASALEALFAEVVAPPVSSAATDSATDLAELDDGDALHAVAATDEQGLPAIDPLMLLGLAPAPPVAPPTDPLQWLRLATDRAARPTPALAAQLVGDAALETQPVLSEQGPSDLERLAAAAQVQGSPAADAVPLPGAAAVAGAGAGEQRAPEGVAVENRTPDASASILGAENVAQQRSSQDAMPRAMPPPVTVPLHSPDWGNEFSARVSWMVERGEQLASIRLSPEQLGPVEVRLAIREGEASIWFGASQADTRAAIEQALPRLREMLAASGLALADAGVFQGSPRDPRHGLVRADARRAASESAEPVVELRSQYRRVGLIDDYA